MGLAGLLGLGDTATGIARGIADIIDRFVETADEKTAAAIIRRRLEAEPMRLQAEINKIEASHRSLFVAGWRPAIGWVCALALAWNWIIRPIAEIALQWAGRPMTLPALNTAEAMPLVFALLGLAGMRTYEKKNNVTG